MCMCSMNSALGFYKAKPVQNDFTAFVDGFQKYSCNHPECEFCSAKLVITNTLNWICNTLGC